MTAQEEEAAIEASEVDASTAKVENEQTSPTQRVQVPESGTKPPKNSEIGKSEYDFEAIGKTLRKWRESSRNQIRKGRKPRLFVDSVIPEEVVEVVWDSLEKATTRAEVDAAFGARIPTDPMMDQMEKAREAAAEVEETLSGLVDG